MENLEALPKADRREIFKDRVSGRLKDLLNVSFATGGKICPVLVMDMYRFTYLVVRPSCTSLSGYNGTVSYLLHPLVSQEIKDVEVVGEDTMEWYFYLIGIGHAGFTVKTAFNGMIPMQKDTANIVFNPRAVDGKIVTAGGREMRPDELLFQDIVLPGMSDTLRNIEELLSEGGK